MLLHVSSWCYTPKTEWCSVNSRGDLWKYIFPFFLRYPGCLICTVHPLVCEPEYKLPGWTLKELGPPKKEKNHWNKESLEEVLRKQNITNQQSISLSLCKQRWENTVHWCSAGGTIMTSRIHRKQMRFILGTLSYHERDLHYIILQTGKIYMYK